MRPLVTFECDTLTIRPWADDVIDSLGYDPRAPYVERFWLGVLGPSTTWLLRRIDAGFDGDPEGFEMSLGETAQALGLGDRGGRHSPFLRTVNRMIQFELAQVITAGAGELAGRRRPPPLNPPPEAPPPPATAGRPRPLAGRAAQGAARRSAAPPGTPAGPQPARAG